MTRSLPQRPPPRRQSRRGFLILAAMLAAVALLAEFAASRWLCDDDAVTVGPMRLRVDHNSGVAFGAGKHLPTAAVLAVTAITTAGVGVYAWHAAPRSSVLTAIALAAVLAGAATNLIDRAGDAHVTDYVHTDWGPTFNLADVYVIAGVAILIAGLLRDATSRKVDTR